jgi:hypothetical protein
MIKTSIHTRKVFTVIGFVLMAVTSLLGQDKTPLGATEKLPVEEQIIFWTDREVYLPGENIWISAEYLVNDQKPGIDLSKVLYVELFSFSGKSLVRDKLNITENKASGVLAIPPGMQSGYYLIRVYTQYQRNLQPSDLANKVISLINPELPLPGMSVKKETEIQSFYLDKTGDDLVKYGLFVQPSNNKVFTQAFLSESNSGITIPVKMLNNGLGFFELSQSHQNNYLFNGVLESRDTLTKTIKLNQPEVKVDVQKNKGASSIRISVKNKDTLGAEGKCRLSVFSPAFEKIVDTNIVLTNNECAIYWPYQVFETGINYIMLTSDSDEPFLVKAIYHFPEEPLQLNIKTNKKVYKSREKVSVELNFDQLNENIEQNLTISVVKKGTASSKDELPKYIITNPRMFNTWVQNVTSFSNSLVGQVNLLMAIYSQELTNEKIQFTEFSGDTLRWLPEIRGVSIRGVVKEISSGKKVEGIDVMLSVLGEQPQLQVFRTDVNGEFLFAINHLNDLTNVYLTLRSPRENELEIFIESDFMTEFPQFVEPDFEIDTGMRAYVEELFINKQVSEKIIHENNQPEVTEHIPRFEPDKTIYLSDFVSMESLETVINEIVPHIKVRKKSQHSFFKVYDDKTGIYYDDPLVLIDNLPIYSVDELLTIHPSLIERIELINHTYVYGDYIIQGLIAIYTSTDNFGNIVLPHSFTSLEFQASTDPVIFKPSLYQTNEKKESRSPDFRTILYWNPDFQLSSSGREFSFYTSDHASVYEIIIHGTTNNGRSIAGIQSFKVE